MKVYPKVLTVFPKARYVVSNRKVKMIKQGVVLSVSDERYALWDIVMKHGFGKQYK